MDSTPSSLFCWETFTAASSDASSMRTAHMDMITHQGGGSSHRTEGETSGHARNLHRVHPGHSPADAGGTTKRWYSQHCNSWCFEWAEGAKATSSGHSFEPSAVKDPGRDNIRLDKTSVLVPTTYWSTKGFTTVGRTLFLTMPFPSLPCTALWHSLRITPMYCQFLPFTVIEQALFFCHPQDLVLVLWHWRTVLASPILPWKEDSSNRWRRAHGLSIIPSHVWKASFWAKNSSKKKNSTLDFTVLSQLHKGVWGQVTVWQ